MEPRSQLNSQQGGSGCQSCLGVRNHRSKAGLVVDGHIGQKLAVELDLGLLGAGDEGAVSNALLAAGRVEAGDPEGTEWALPVAAVATGGLTCLHDCLLRAPEY